jgi:hypothetical protein
LSFSSYTTLQSALADWLNRTDLTAQIPDFISLAEAEMKRRLRRTSTRTTLSISTESTTLPSDVAELRSLYLESGSPSQDKPIKIASPEMFAETRARNQAVTGRPVVAMVLGGTLYVAPAPDQTYTLRIIYFAQLIPLSGSVASNAVLTEAPDAYLYGSLLQAEPYLEHDDRAPLWKSKFDAAIDQLNYVRESEEYNASIRDVRLPRVFG